MIVEQLINTITNEAIGTGNEIGWRSSIFEKAVSLLVQNKISHETHYHIMLEVETKVKRYFDRLNMMKFNQEDYERFKQTWTDCKENKRDSFLFELNNECFGYNRETGTLIIKYLEVSKNFTHYHPKPTTKLTLQKTDKGGVLKYKDNIQFFSSKGLLDMYEDGQELIINVDIFIKPCPVCSRYSDFDGELIFCPECEKHQLIAYPNIGFWDLLKLEKEYEEDLIDRYEDLEGEEWGFLKGSPD